ncbi:PEP-CTERM sorting domain-containing protein [Moorena sp. SIO3I6]|uniref:PEP-CTERM sorting domain-containing protein n=1 Tax=Moorena sp. SIO3I6 TaxID=2607831 RepID=UPI0013F6EA98|nr:PEP-CTERM sorting domain-containing protein [Moorena sp. SIO3I6]NEP28159.1 PEP-CTERM sorting domain-containing protein [Moorena sp. SIO3I6]
MINFSKHNGVVTTAIALSSATVGVLPAAAFQIIKHEFSGTLELLSYSIIYEPIIYEPTWLSISPFPRIDVTLIEEFIPKTKDYEGFVEYTTEGELLSWFLDVEGSLPLGSDTLEPFPSSPTITSPTITSSTITLVPIDPPPIIPCFSIDPCIPVDPRPSILFFSTPDNWTLDIDFERYFYTDYQTITWNRKSGIRFTPDSDSFLSTIYVDPNPNFKETITNDPSKADPTSVPEPASGLALLGLTALGAGSLLRKKDK